MGWNDVTENESSTDKRKGDFVWFSFLMFQCCFEIAKRHSCNNVMFFSLQKKFKINQKDMTCDKTLILYSARKQM